MNLWQQLIGQDRAIEQLTLAAAQDRPSHAWLFSGQPGVGVPQAALTFATALLCQQEDPAARACGICPACQSVQAGSHPDLVHFVTEKTTISIEEARDLVVKAQDRPSLGRWRIILLEDADRMPERTSNVLLKAIEEPPPYTIWLLTTPSPAQVLITIRSRCRAVPLATPRPQQVAAYLQTQLGLSPEAADLTARLAQGNLDVARQLASDPDARQRRTQVVSLPLTLRNLPAAMDAADRLISIAEAQAEADAQARNQADREALLRALGYEEGDKLTPTHRAQVRQLEEDQKRRAKRIQTDTLDRFLSDLQTLLRDVLTLQVGSGSELINLHLADQITAYAQQKSPQQTLELLETLKLTRRRIQGNVSPRLAFEALMASFLPSS